MVVVVSILYRALCINKNTVSYNNYGKRGIKVLFKNYNEFKTWALASGYTDDLTIDRINVNDNYHPSNCRWVSIKEQNLNRTSNKLLNQISIPDLVSEFKNTPLGSRMTLAKKYKCSYSAIKNIIYKYGGLYDKENG